MPGSAQSQHRDIFGIKVSALGWSEALEHLQHGLNNPGPQRIFNFLNANNANLALRDSRYREGLARSEVLPDGIGVDIASRTLHGAAFPSNLNGTDFVPALLVYADRPMKIALIGARADILDRAAEGFRAATPWHQFHAVSDGFFSEDDTPAILDRLAEIDPDITLVAMGSPHQELWIDTHIREGHGRLVFGVGALFDFISGTVPRAPRLLRDLRLEWLWRLGLEPSRLWYRYIVGNPVFLYRVLRYKLQGGFRNDQLAT